MDIIISSTEHNTYTSKTESEIEYKIQNIKNKSHALIYLLQSQYIL